MKEGPWTRFKLRGGDVARCEVTNALVGLLGQAIYWAGPKPMDAGLFEVDVDGRLRREVLDQETGERIVGEVTMVGRSVLPVRRVHADGDSTDHLGGTASDICLELPERTVRREGWPTTPPDYLEKARR